MKYRLRYEPVEPHFWSADNPHPAQEMAEMKDGQVIRTYGGHGRKRHYLREGDVILPTGLIDVFDVISTEDFHKRYEAIHE